MLYIFLGISALPFNHRYFPQAGVQLASMVQHDATRPLCCQPQCCEADDIVLWKHRQGVVSFHHRCFNGRYQCLIVFCCEPFSRNATYVFFF
jgi:hypothetical protein